MRNFELPGRSTVMAEKGAVATSHPLATSAALDVLRQGGNAVDAAVTAVLVLCVVEPQSVGIGGDMFALYAEGGKMPVYGLNGSGRAPAAASFEAVSSTFPGQKKVQRNHPHAVTVPGAVDGYITLLERFGSWGIDKIVEPARQYAETGFPLHERVRSDWRMEVDLIRQDPDSAAVLLDGGKLPALGSRIVFPALARTLAEIGKKGRAGFYDGWVLDDMLTKLKAGGGLHEASDFAATESTWVDPISTDYRGYKLWEIPPNGQGLVALEMLQILDRLGTAPHAQSLERYHQQIEAAHLGYADRDAFFADLEHMPTTVEAVLDPARMDAQAAKISMDGTLSPVPVPDYPGQSDTVYLTVVDGDRNAVSLISSVYDSFGSTLMAPQSGVVFQNRAFSFRIDDPQHPNAYGPGKRPMHTIIPAMLTKGDDVQMSFGVMGADYQPQGQAHVITSMVDYGLDIQAALDLARVHSSPKTGGVQVEAGVPAEIRRGLQDLGHKLEIADKAIGGGQGIWLHHDTGFMSAGSDPRKDGQAGGF